MISFENFSFQYKNLTEPTLRDITLNIKQGEKVLIAGPSGSGKSTLAHCINGLIPFTYEGTMTGTFTVNGENLSKKSIFEISKTVGTILQDLDGQFIGLSVAEDVAFSFENDCVPVEQMKAEVAKALGIVEMTDLMEQSPHDLSGGQKQRVSLAGILSTQADVLLFDEPLANLDPASGKKAMELIEEIHKKTNKTIIIIEHRIEDVLEQPIDKIVVMDGGQLKAAGTPDEIIASDVLKRHGLREPLYIEALKYAGCELSVTDKLTDLDHLHNASFTEKLRNWFEPQPDNSTSEHSEPLLSMENVRFSYDSQREVIKGVSFEVNEGEIVSLLGNNGAGKSTLSHLITGIVRQSSGNIKLSGENINDWTVRKRGGQIGYVMQNPNQMMTKQMIRDEVALGLTVQGLPKETVDAKVEHTLQVCGLFPYRNWPISALSYGQKKRVSIASVLVMEPKLIILDEPTAGQDYKHYTEFMDFIAGLAKNGLSFIFITHDMHLALEYTDRSVVLSRGEVIANDRVASVLTNADVIERANLKETSLSKLAKTAGLSSAEEFVQHFINYEKKVKHHE